MHREIGAMPGNYQMSIDQIVGECAEVHSLGIGGVMLFGLPESKDDMATGAYDENGKALMRKRAVVKGMKPRAYFAAAIAEFLPLYVQIIEEELARGQAA